MKKKILIIGPFPPPVSGVSIANEVLSRGLSVKKWKVSIINSEYSQEITSRHGKVSIKKLYFIRTYLLIFKVFFSDIIYITIGQSFFGVLKYLPFMLAAKLAGKKLVVHLHGNHLLNEYNSLKGIKKAIFAKIISMFDNGIVLSKSLRNNFRPFLDNDSIFELNNFFEKGLCMPNQEFKQQKDYAELKVVFLSNLLEEKGINVLLEAVKILKDKGISIQVKVAGKMIKENDLSVYFNTLDNVTYVGVVHGRQKQNLLLWSTVFCLPTFYKMEGQPISIIEAMAMGNLILTTNHAGIMDICKEENAVFCKIKSSQDLADKLESLYNNSNNTKQIGLFNRTYALSSYTEEQFIENANKILLQCIT
jgi:glycosyltransferase involved in cell wall biosynthesis